ETPDAASPGVTVRKKRRLSVAGKAFRKGAGEIGIPRRRLGSFHGLFRSIKPPAPGRACQECLLCVSLLRVKHTVIPKARAKLAAGLPSTTQILRGSLLHRRIRHRTGCAVCARGPGHPVWVLTVSYPGGRTKQISLSAEQKTMVQHGAVWFSRSSGEGRSLRDASFLGWVRGPGLRSRKKSGCERRKWWQRTRQEPAVLPIRPATSWEEMPSTK